MITSEGEPPMGMMEDVGDAQAEADRWNSKGNAYLAVKDYITAISCFDLALKTHPGSDVQDVLLANRATALFRIGEYKAAAEGFQKASELRPDKHAHFTCLGKVYLRWGGHEAEALEALVTSLRVEHTTVAANLVAKVEAAPENSIQNDSRYGDDADEEDEIFFSPLAVIADDMRRKDSRRVAAALRGTSVARAAIAAGAAPVKWGREGAEERAKASKQRRGTESTRRFHSISSSSGGNEKVTSSEGRGGDRESSFIGLQEFSPFDGCLDAGGASAGTEVDVNPDGTSKTFFAIAGPPDVSRASSLWVSGGEDGANVGGIEDMKYTMNTTGNTGDGMAYRAARLGDGVKTCYNEGGKYTQEKQEIPNNTSTRNELLPGVGKVADGHKGFHDKGEGHGCRPLPRLRRWSSDVVAFDPVSRQRQRPFCGSGGDDQSDTDAGRSCSGRNRDTQMEMDRNMASVPGRGGTKLQTPLLETRWSWWLRHRLRQRLGQKRDTIPEDAESEWGQAAPTGRQRLWWPGRSRHITIGPYLESPAVARTECGSEFFPRFPPAPWARNTDMGTEAAMEHLKGHAANRLGSSAPNPSPPDVPQHATTTGGGMNQPPGRRSQAPSPGRVSNRGRRLRRWVSLSDDATSFSSEAAARKWIIDILGSRAIGLVGEGGGKGDRSGNMMSLSEALKDGRVLVRLAHAVGGRKTIGMAKEVEAATPMLELVNVRTFITLARAIGVPEHCLLHPKDLVGDHSSGRCSPAVMKCLTALSDAVCKNAEADRFLPANAHHGPLLRSGGFNVPVTINNTPVVPTHPSKVQSPRECQKGDQEEGVLRNGAGTHGASVAETAEELGEETSTSPDSDSSSTGGCYAGVFSSSGQGA